MEKLSRDSSKGKILYHIGNQAPISRPMRSEYLISDSKEGWTRPWLKSPVSSGVFLTDNPALVIYHHNISGEKIYSVFVPFWVIKESGGLHTFSGAKEIIIPEELWNYCKILSSKDIKKLEPEVEGLKKEEDKIFDYVLIEKPKEEKRQPLTEEQFRQILQESKEKHKETSMKHTLSKRSSDLTPWLEAFSKLKAMAVKLNKLKPTLWTLSQTQLQEMYDEMFPIYVSSALFIKNNTESFVANNIISQPMADNAYNLINHLAQAFNFEV